MEVTLGREAKVKSHDGVVQGQQGCTQTGGDHEVLSPYGRKCVGISDIG